MVEDDRDPVTDRDDRASGTAAETNRGAAPGGDVTVDEMSAASFPASDPPATWTWEVRPSAAEPDGADDA
jgi:hypothetical protein